VTSDTSATEVALTAPAGPARWTVAVLRTARPRQWPKNLLVFAAPLAGASLGRRDGLIYALAAAAAFGFASVAVYFVNDVADAERDRRHPRKRHRPVASGELPKQHAIVLGVVCALVGLAAGVTTFDASIGGLGGCPYAPGAAGNLATEDVVNMLHRMGVETGIDLPKLVEAGEVAQELIGRKLAGKFLQAALGERDRAQARRRAVPAS